MDIHAYIQSGIIESYLLGIAGAEEQAELEQMRRKYPEIEKAIHSAEEWLHGITSPYATPVPSQVKERIFDSIKEEIDTPAAMAQIRPNRPVYKYLAAASLILLTSSIVANLILYKKYLTEKNNALALQEKQQTLMAENQIIQARMNTISNDLTSIISAGSSRIIMNAVPGKNNMQSVLIQDASRKQLLMVSNSLPTVPAGKQYQLWAIVNGKPVNAGLLTVCDPYCKFPAIAGAEAYAVTLENAGGSVNPTTDQMFVFGKVNS